MKKKFRGQQHPNQENKSGNAVYASSTSLNSSTNQTLTHDVDMPEGTESDYKKSLTEANKKQSTLPSSKTTKQ